MQTIPLVVNPMAGKGHGISTSDEIKSFFAEQGISVRICPTESSGHATVLVEQLIGEGERTILSLGGDGTAFEVINGIFRSGMAHEVRLGLLPHGTGNSFMRDYGISTWQEVAQCVIEQKSQKVDIGKVTCGKDDPLQSIYFHNVVGLGMMARGCELRHKRFRFLKQFAYHAAFFAMLPSIQTQTIDLKMDGNGKTIRTPLLAVCNSQYTGRDMRISPESVAGDGKLEILYCDPISAWQFVRLFAALPSGAHMQHPAVHVLTAQTIEISNKDSDLVMIDGELQGSSPLRIELLPGALEIYAG